MECYKRFEYCFIVDGLLFSSAISNNTNTIFIKSTGLKEAHHALINCKLHKTLSVISLTMIKNWDLVKIESKWIKTMFTDSNFSSEADHFNCGFKTRNSHGL